jgi:hypothetical protein
MPRAPACVCVCVRVRVRVRVCVCVCGCCCCGGGAAAGRPPVSHARVHVQGMPKPCTAHTHAQRSATHAAHLPRELEPLLARDLGHGAVWRQIAVQNLQVPAGLDWLRQRQHHVLPRSQLRTAGQVLRHCLACGVCACVCVCAWCVCVCGVCVCVCVCVCVVCVCVDGARWWDETTVGARCRATQHQVQTMHAQKIHAQTRAHSARARAHP